MPCTLIHGRTDPWMLALPISQGQAAMSRYSVVNKRRRADHCAYGRRTLLLSGLNAIVEGVE
jgi:hypothetical protein